MPWTTFESLRQLVQRISALWKKSGLQAKHLLYLSLLILCFPITLPLAFCVSAVLLAADKVARSLSLSRYKRSSPPITHLRQRLKAGIYALKWLSTALQFLPLVFQAASLVIMDRFDGRTGTRQQRLISNVPVDLYTAVVPRRTGGSADRPIIILLHGGNYGPLVCKKWMMAAIASKLQKIGYTVIIPEVDASYSENIETIIRDLKAVLAWAGLHASELHGTPEDITLMGHGFGAYIALLLCVQMAAVQSRDEFRMKHPDYEPRAQYHGTSWGSHHHEVVLPNGLLEARLYAPEIDIPTVRRLILLAPINDTQKYLEWETSQGTAPLSPMRQILGRSYLFHSPAHLLFAARSVLKGAYLPSSILIIHGGRDMVIRSSQSDMLQELLAGAGVQTAHLAYHPTLNHVDLLKGLGDYASLKSSAVLTDVLASMTSFS